MNVNDFKRTKNQPFSLLAIVSDAMTDAEQALLMLQDKQLIFTNYDHCVQLDGTGGHKVFSFIRDNIYLHIAITDNKTHHKLTIYHYNNEELVYTKETRKQKEFNALAREYIELLISI